MRWAQGENNFEGVFFKLLISRERCSIGDRGRVVPSRQTGEEPKRDLKLDFNDIFMKKILCFKVRRMGDKN